MTDKIQQIADYYGYEAQSRQSARSCKDFPRIGIKVLSAQEGKKCPILRHIKGMVMLLRLCARNIRYKGLLKR